MKITGLFGKKLQESFTSTICHFPKLTVRRKASGTKIVLLTTICILSGNLFLQANPVKNLTHAMPPIGGTVSIFPADPQDTFPVPSVPNQLFYLQRTTNTNTIICEANINSKGQLDESSPVHVFWIRYPEGGVKKELNYIQRVFAYGVKEQLQPNGTYSLHVVSYKKQNLTLRKSAKDNKYHVYTTINRREVVLNRIFIRIDPGGTFWAPNVIYIEIKGRDETTGEEVMERFKPS